MLQEIHDRSHNRAQEKLERFIKAKEQEKLVKLDKIRKQTARGTTNRQTVHKLVTKSFVELRKLELEEKGIKRKYHQPDIIEEHISKASELYGPLMRNGEHPKRWHQIIDEKMKRYQAQFIGKLKKYRPDLAIIVKFARITTTNQIYKCFHDYHQGYFTKPIVLKYTQIASFGLSAPAWFVRRFWQKWVRKHKIFAKSLYLNALKHKVSSSLVSLSPFLFPRD